MTEELSDNQFYHYTSKRSFKILTSQEGSWRSSMNLEVDAQYGPGWYVTTLPPDTATSALLQELWGGAVSNLHKTEYWLLISVLENYRGFKLPDADRPHVIFIPMYNRGMTGDLPKPTGWFSKPILLLTGGRRVETASGYVKVQTLVVPQSQFVLLPAHMSIEEGLTPLQRSFFKIHDPSDYHEEGGFEEEMINQSDALFKVGLFNEALDVVDKLLSVVPESVLGWSNRGAIMAKLERRSEALDCYDHALELDPKHVATLVNKTACLIKIGRNGEALECCNAALSIDSNSASAWHNKGNVLIALDKSAEALDCFQRATDLNPELAEAWNSRAGLLSKHAMLKLESESETTDGFSELADGLGMFNKALELKPDYRNARHNLRSAVSVVLSMLPYAYVCEAAIFNAAHLDSKVYEQVFERVFKNYVPTLHPRYIAEVNNSKLRKVLKNRKDTVKLLVDVMEKVVSLGVNDLEEEVMQDPRFRIGIHLVSDGLINVGLPHFALRTANNLIKVVVAAGERLQLAKTLNDAGVTCRKVGAFDQALNCYENAYPLYVEAHDQKFCAHVQFNLGAVYYFRRKPQDFQKAKTAFQRAASIYSELGLTADLMEAKKLLAELATDEQRYR